jgi:cation diffusion facilitator CzcD-associated flavoprotein CzcO
MLRRFRCTVARIIQHKAGNWVVTYLDGTRGTYDTYTADYVVISTGLYSSPRIPQFQVGT